MKKNILKVITLAAAISAISSCTSYSTYSYAIEGHPDITTPTIFPSTDESSVEYSDTLVQKRTSFYNSIWFNKSSTTVDYNSKDVLYVLSYNKNYLQDSLSSTIQIIGYSTNSDSKKQNSIIATKRAMFIKKYFVENGIDDSRIKIKTVTSKNDSLYEEVNGKNPSNQRVDIVYIDNPPDNYKFEKQPIIGIISEYTKINQ